MRGWHRIRRVFAPRSLRLQLLSRSLFILAGLLLLIGVLQYVFMEQFLIKNKVASIQSQFFSVSLDIWVNTNFDNGRAKGPFLPEASLAFVGPGDSFRIISTNPRTGSVPRLTTEDYREALGREQRPPHYRIVKDDKGMEQLVVLQRIAPRGRLAQISTSMEPIRNVLVSQLWTFLGLAAVALGMGVAAFLPVLRRTLVPLSNMIETVEQIDAGKLDERLPAHQGQLEIDRLSRSFNRMLERLEDSFETEKEAKEQMRRFIADASHELRTPLTSIHGFLEVLLRGAAQKPDQLDKALRSMYGESERLNKLVRDLLLLARLDRHPTADLKNESLSGIVDEMEPQLRLLAGRRNVQFSVQPDVSACIDKDKIKQVLLNLFHNAVQHTDPDGGTIRVSLEQTEEEALLTVQDNGSGIPEEHVSRLFERFYRIDSSRARIHGGAGLGLSITKSIVELHGGTIGVNSRVGEGSSFVIRVPMNGTGGQRADE
ncbi:HAMP domain-containing histidine kinase [Paenibacillus sp. MZ04-78.2]|uniref:sensor histidine kinase n=1 Tax=Paenibacillus sp. MZ04-78.2 TaxID=2962034 RepID=UPI0020B8511C|nr:HAMP domain-containing sensor histidine kinase [Paenibacillus sp. MZ04-78.2]MCP3773162.1 HAMP domain-containing histidine kinase [Paenibacillus sp. MZ04-78.2]